MREQSQTAMWTRGKQQQPKQPKRSDYWPNSRELLPENFNRDRGQEHENATHNY